MSTQDSDELITHEVNNHYENTDAPYYLAELGKFFREKEIELPEGVRFKDFLRSRFYDSLVVLQDTRNPARIAIAPPEKQDLVLRQLKGESPGALDSGEVEVARLPLALFAGFCKMPLPGDRVYFRTIRPFRYVSVLEAPDDSYVENDEQFRPSSFAGRSVHSLSDADKEEVYGYIRMWADGKSIDLQTLYYDRGVTSAKPTVPGALITNALQRLIDAQERGLSDKLRIPADIASILMRLP